MKPMKPSKPSRNKPMSSESETPASDTPETDAPRGKDDASPQEIRDVVERLFHTPMSLSRQDWGPLANVLLGSATKIEALERQRDLAHRSLANAREDRDTWKAVAIKAGGERDRAERERADAERALSKIEEDEAALCPDDQSWQDTIKALTKERDAAIEGERKLDRWKCEMTAVENTWDAQAVADLLGIEAGFSTRERIEPGIKKLIQERDSALSQIWQHQVEATNAVVAAGRWQSIAIRLANVSSLDELQQAITDVGEMQGKEER